MHDKHIYICLCPYMLYIYIYICSTWEGFEPESKMLRIRIRFIMDMDPQQAYPHGLDWAPGRDWPDPDPISYIDSVLIFFFLKISSNIIDLQNLNICLNRIRVQAKIIHFGSKPSDNPDPSLRKSGSKPSYNPYPSLWIIRIRSSAHGVSLNPLDDIIK